MKDVKEIEILNKRINFVIRKIQNSNEKLKKISIIALLKTS
jgi:hypothetical protein